MAEIAVPIYEFYCAPCNTLFNFFSSQIDTRARPPCPRCGKLELERRPARFATLRGGGGGESEEEGEESPFPGLDEGRMEGAMESLAREMEGLGDEPAEDPRQLARFFRRFGEMSGLAPGPRLEEMLHRLEAGEDPEALEGEMGEGMDEEAGFEEFFQLKKQAQARRSRRPRVDETLYFL
jgi:putative FmdB family regulatory protein